jgi:SSS family solute:Na+ symporter
VGVIWGFRFPRVGAVVGMLLRHDRRGADLQGLAESAVHALCLLGHCLRQPSWPTSAAAFGIKDDEETLSVRQEVRAFLDDIDEPSESGKQWRKS